MPARTVFSLDDLSTSVPKIFQQVQLTTANHQKNYIALYKLQTDAAKQRENVQNGRSVKLTGERAFEDVFISMLSRALPVKKGATVADRILKFVGGYTKLINEKGSFLQNAIRCKEHSELSSQRPKTGESQGTMKTTTIRPHASSTGFSASSLRVAQRKTKLSASVLCNA